MLKLRHALLASICLLPLLGVEAQAANAGVTAAVNQNAKSIPPGGGVRTVVLGANVVQDERIETDGAGLVQILLADGTTFTVGPNSSLVIDRFVYDPDADTAEVAASLGRGVFRFIGGRTSKTEGGVTLNTPVGTVGIRGGMADLNFTGQRGNIAQIDLLFGNEVTLSGPNGGDRLFQPGYSIIIGPNGQPSVIKTPPGSANFIQQALAGRPGATGGSSQQPSDDDVKNSEVANDNSGSTPPNQQDIPPPDLTAIDLATPKPNDNHQAAEDVTGKVPTTLSGKYYGYSSAYVTRTGGTGPAIAGFYRNILPDTEVTFDPTNRTFGGYIKVDDGTGSTPPAGVLQVAFGHPGGDSYYYNDLVFVGTGPASAISLDGVQAAAGSSGSTAAVSVGLGSADCECSFIQLGYWAAGVTDPTLGDLTAIGTFVTADISSAADYQVASGIYGDAEYDGIAIGYVTRSSGTEAAMGDLHMSYDFSYRSGSINITNFGEDGLEFGGGVWGGTEGYDDPTFYSSESGTVEQPAFAADGTFVNNGSSVAAGVIGNFAASHTASNPQESWSAGGVFAGTMSGSNPPDND